MRPLCFEAGHSTRFIPWYMGLRLAVSYGAQEANLRSQLHEGTATVLQAAIGNPQEVWLGAQHDELRRSGRLHALPALPNGPSRT